MDGKKLITPQFRLLAGDYVITDGIYAECVSSRKNGLDWGRVRLDLPIDEKLNLRDGDPAALELGYDGDYDEIISGVLSVSTWGLQKEFLISDGLKKIRDTTIKATFIDCTPQDIITYVLTCAGIDRYELDQTTYPKKKAVIREMNGIKAIAEVGALWGISKPCFFKKGRFLWGIAEDQEEIYVLDEDETLLSLEKIGTMWRAETIAIPWIHHSQEIIVRHRDFSGTVQAEEVKVESSRKGTNMTIWFRGE